VPDAAASSTAATFRFAANLDAFEQAAARLGECLAEADVQSQARFNAEVVFEEISTNIVRHGSAGAIEVALVVADDALTFVFTDDGAAFDPCEAPDAAPFGPLENVKLGGLGIPLARKVSERMEYRREAETNRLTVRVARRAAAA
jgi:anti-sigma regulatory factor (Ser/Thr protein kinase)